MRSVCIICIELLAVGIRLGFVDGCVWVCNFFFLSFFFNAPMCLCSCVWLKWASLLKILAFEFCFIYVHCLFYVSFCKFIYNGMELFHSTVVRAHALSDSLNGICWRCCCRRFVLVFFPAKLNAKMQFRFDCMLAVIIQSVDSDTILRIPFLYFLDEMTQINSDSELFRFPLNQWRTYIPTKSRIPFKNSVIFIQQKNGWMI